MRKNIPMHVYFFMTLAVMSVFVFISEISANQLVSGRYLKASGKSIVVQLIISQTPPPSIIVVQQLPKGTEVIHTDPGVKKYNPGRGVAKWLLTNVQQGKLLITMDLKNSIFKGEIKGEIRYRDNSGKMVTSLLVQ